MPFGKINLTDQNSQKSKNRSVNSSLINHTLNNYGEPEQRCSRINEIWLDGKDIKQKQEKIEDISRSRKVHTQTTSSQILREAFGNRKFYEKRQKLEQAHKYAMKAGDQNAITHYERQIDMMNDSSCKDTNSSSITTARTRAQKFIRSNWTHRKGPQTTEDLEKIKRRENYEQMEQAMAKFHIDCDKENAIKKYDQKNNEGMTQVSSLNAPSYTIGQSTSRCSSSGPFVKTYTGTESSRSNSTFQPEIQSGLSLMGSNLNFTKITMGFWWI